MLQVHESIKQVRVPLSIKRSVGAAQEMNLRNPIQVTKHASEGIRPAFETKGRLIKCQPMRGENKTTSRSEDFHFGSSSILPHLNLV